MRFAKIFGQLFFLVYGFFSLYFYQERVIFADSAFQLFKLINFQNFTFEANRYSTVFVQILPLLAIKFDFSLKAIMMLFSLSYVLVYYLVFLLCVYVLKNASAGLLIPVILILGVRQSYFHTVTETYQGLVYCVLFYSWYIEQNKIRAGKIKFYFISLLIVLLCFFAHPVTFFALLFVIIWRLTEMKKPEWSTHLFMLVFITLIYCLKFFLTTNESYEGKLFSQLFESVTLAFLPSMQFLIGSTYKIYPFLIIIFSYTIVQLIKKKRNIQALVCVSFLIFYTAVGILTFSSSDAVFMMEKNFLPLVFIVCIPFLELLLKFNHYQLKLILFSSLIYSFCLIAYQGQLFGMGLKNLNRIMESNISSKLIIKSNAQTESYGLVKWSLPFETLLLSSMRSAEKSKTIYFQIGDFHPLNESHITNYFYGPSFWPLWDADLFNKRYFNLQPGTYFEIN